MTTVSSSIFAENISPAVVFVSHLPEAPPHPLYSCSDCHLSQLRRLESSVFDPSSSPCLLHRRHSIMMKFKPPPSRKKVEPPSSENRDALMMKSMVVEVSLRSNVNLRIQQARNYSVGDTHQDGCTRNFRIFESAFGNYIVLVIFKRVGSLVS
ncbi:hypothetical protein ACS0TY_017621 [Phlomoides rotata]